MPLNAIQALLWDAVLLLKTTGEMSQKEAASLCLVRFTWSREQAQSKLEELQKRLINKN